MKNIDKKNFIWNFLGLTVNSFSSFFFLIIANRINGQHDAGIFTFAYSLISLFYVIGIYYNRTFQISDVKERYSNKEYIYSKIVTCSIMILLTFVLSSILNYSLYKFSIIMLICLFRAMDAFSDSLYAIVQKNQKLYISGISMFFKGFLGVGFFYLTDKLTNNLVLSCLSLIVVNLLILIIYDRESTKKYITKDAKWSNVSKLLKEATPIFIFCFLGLFLVNSSKYTLDYYGTPEMQNIFGIILMPGTMLSLCCQYLLNPYLLNLTTLYKNNKITEFTSQLKKICTYIFIFGIICEIGCYILGIPVLNILYGFDLEPYKFMLMFIILGATFMAITSILSSALTILKENKKQVSIYVYDSIISLILSLALVKNFELMGATLTYLIIMILQFVNYLILFKRKTKLRENKKGDKLKILVVCQHFYPESFRINDICFELAKRGNDVTVLTGLPNYPRGKVLPEYRWFKNRNQVINGVKIKRCSLIGRGTSTVRMGLNYMWFAIFGSLKAIFMKKDFDLVYVYQLSPISMVWPAVKVKEYANIPLIIHCLDQWPISVTTGPISKTSLLYKILYKMSVYTYNKADLITISSKSFKKYFENELHISAKDKGLLYYPSYAESDYENINHEQNKKFDLLFAGNIGPAQSVETIIEAANILKKSNNIKFHIVGDGLSKKSCEDLAKRYNLKNVIFYGFHPVSDMPKYYSLADMCMITMVNNEVVNSTLPAKVQSYMIASKPIIGAISGEVKDVINEAKCGLCCDSLDYKEFARLILEASKDDNKLKEWSENSKKYYLEHFEREKCIDDMEELFRRILK